MATSGKDRRCCRGNLAGETPLSSSIGPDSTTQLTPITAWPAAIVGDSVHGNGAWKCTSGQSASNAFCEPNMFNTRLLLSIEAHASYTDVVCCTRDPAETVCGP